MRVIRHTILSVGLLLSGSAGAARAQEPAAAPRVRTPAAVMSFRGAEWLERPQRLTEERPSEVIEVLGLRPGDVVADIGAGSGYFTRRMAPLVAPGGTVFAVDVQPEMLDILMESVEAEGIEGIVPVLGDPDDPKLPAGAVDWMLMVDVYHELADPAAMLARMHAALATDGRVALLEYRSEDSSGDHIRAEHRMSVRQVVAEWEASGFRLVDLREFLPSQHLFILQPVRTSLAGVSGARPILRHYDLFEAMCLGAVELNVAGTGGDALALSIRRTRPEPMVVTLAAGTYFEAAGAAGDLVARRDAVVLLREDGIQRWSVEARRAQRDAPAPGAADRLDLRGPQGRAEVGDVLWLFQNADVYPAVAPTVEQIAVWIVTEDLGWEALSAHARSASVHAANAVAFAAAYTNAAGVDIKGKRIWSERAQFVSSITDEGLKRGFAELEAN
jgi:predicted methyltransferase